MKLRIKAAVVVAALTLATVTGATAQTKSATCNKPFEKMTALGCVCNEGFKRDAKKNCVCLAPKKIRASDRVCILG